VNPGVELVTDAPMCARASRFFGQLRLTAPAWVHSCREYSGSREVLMVYGAGDLARAPYVARHLARGGRVVCWDLAYWDRRDSLRVSIDGKHPTAQHLSACAFGAPRRSFTLREDADPRGYVLLVGLGRKSVVASGEEPFAWEHMALQRARSHWPGAKVVWRPKGELVGFQSLATLARTPIETALMGARGVICRHSNVAVDACVAGVPVVCDGGAAYALYKDNPNPTPTERLAFLNRLSWWEWHKSDTAQFWLWLAEALVATKGSPCTV
jgi:hypothetical protein